MIDLILIIISTLLISLLAFVGVFTLSLKDSLLDKIIILLVSLSAGALIGGAFLHLLPEAIEASTRTSLPDVATHAIIEVIAQQTGWGIWTHFIIDNFQEMSSITIFPHSHIDINLFLYLIIGFFMFFIVEKILHWRHCHKGYCEIHTFAHMNLLGDSIHNFIDGLIMATSFIASIPLGVITAFAIATHELPQEIGDFGVLLHGGYEKKRALIMNFVVALTVVAGGIIGYFLLALIKPIFTFLLPFAAGGFFYIAATDLIPELKKEESMKKSVLVLLIFALGIIVMWLLRILFHA